MRRLVVVAVGLPSLAVAIAVVAAIAGAGAQGCSAQSGPVGGVPPQLVPLFQGAAARYNLGSEGAAILAAINYVESNFDSNEPGVRSGANSADAAGPMQIGIGGKAGDTWDLVKVNAPGDPPGQPPNVYDEGDAVYSAAHYLALNGLTADPSTWHDAVWRYNHADWYVSAVLERAQTYYAQGLRGSGSSTADVSFSSPASCSASSTAGYVDPFTHADVNASRIDQGVDYGGSGEIDALGPGRVIIATGKDKGWGNGNGYVSYQLIGGVYAGDYIYVAEGITPAVYPGEPITAGQSIGTFNGHSIEIGFALGQGDIALAHTAYHPDGADTAAGRAMNQLLTSLGAQAGHQDMGDCGGPCPIVGGPLPNVAGMVG